MLPAVNNPAVLELEGDAAANIEVLAVPLCAVVMNADHAAVITLGHVHQCGGGCSIAPVRGNAPSESCSSVLARLHALVQSFGVRAKCQEASRSQKGRKVRRT